MFTRSQPYWLRLIMAVVMTVGLLGAPSRPIRSAAAAPVEDAGALAPAATQILGGTAAEGNLRVELYDAGHVGLYRAFEAKGNCEHTSPTMASFCGLAPHLPSR
ncbi:MAG: hypothetical protein JW850_05165, partial [Thermoflexales bacterium]|nr:hypothetical protein [Thermoflexales bacterium]